MKRPDYQSFYKKPDKEANQGFYSTNVRRVNNTIFVIVEGIEIRKKMGIDNEWKVSKMLLATTSVVLN